MSGKPVKLTSEAIVDKALVLAGEHGLGSLSMRKLAAAMGVQAMSLYNHIDGRDDLVARLVERVVSEYEVPRIGPDWMEAMKRRARSMHGVLLRRPWAVAPLLSRRNSGPNMFRFVDATLGVLVTAGFSYELADYAWNAMDNHVFGFTMQEANFPIERGEYADVAREYQDSIDAGNYPYLSRMSPLVMNGEYSGLHDFDFGLDIILDGLEAMLPGRRKRRPPVP